MNWKPPGTGSLRGPASRPHLASRPGEAPEPEYAVDLETENQILNLLSAGELDPVTGILQLVANGARRPRRP